MQTYAVSLAAPAYNEGASLRGVLEGWLSYLSHCPALSTFEIVVCNDGSTDDTGTILDEMARQDARIRPVHFAGNKGAAVALSSAIAHTTLPFVLLIDSDGQFPIEPLERMLAKLDGVHGVIGVRLQKEGSGFGRSGTTASAWLCNLLMGSRLRDFNSAFKLVDGTLLRSLTLEAKGLNYSTEVTAKLLERRAKLAEIEITHQPRAGGKSSMRALRDAFHRLLFVLYIGFRQLLFALCVLERKEVS